MSPERILYINGGTMDRGGISSYMMNYYRHFDKDKLQIDFISHGQGGVHDEEIEKLGGRIFCVPTKKKNYFKNQKEIKRIIKEGNYKIVHSHMDTMNGPMLKLAYKLGVKHRISHSHNTDHLTNNKFKRLIHESARKLIPNYATYLFACSEAAGKWLYDNSPFQVIPNAINVDDFTFRPETREQIRKELGINDKFVIGHIGKFEYQKNHKFLIDVFFEVTKHNPDAVLLLIGDGSLKNEMHQKVKDLGISNQVYFLGQRSDVNSIMNSFDIFILPSNFEGLPVVSVEAQTNGLSCVCSDKITKEINITNRVRFLSLNENTNEWAKALCSEKQRNANSVAEISDAGYDIKKEAAKLQKFYLELLAEV